MSLRRLLILPTLYASWLTMMAVHEFGHVAHAWFSGGHVVRVIVPLLGFSRTDVFPNPSPSFVTWGGPLWWPVVVSAAGVPALTAIGFAAGAWFPGRFVTPLVTVVAFFGLAFGTQAASGDHSYWQISPLTAGAFDVGAAPGVASFYPYLPDLSIAQVVFAAGLVVAVLGGLGLPVARMRWLAAVITAAGLAAAGTAVALAGTGRLDPHGMIVIPALHDAASDQPLRYTPACSRTPIPVCVNPAYAGFLPAVTATVGPELRNCSSGS